MFEKMNAFRRTVKEGVKNTKWANCSDLVGKTGVGCLGIIQGTNAFGEFTALVADDGTNYYIPRWYNEKFHAENFNDEELAFLMSGAEITITKREYKTGNKKQYTYNVKIGEYAF